MNRDDGFSSDEGLRFEAAGCCAGNIGTPVDTSTPTDTPTVTHTPVHTLTLTPTPTNTPTLTPMNPAQLVPFTATPAGTPERFVAYWVFDETPAPTPTPDVAVNRVTVICQDDCDATLNGTLALVTGTFSGSGEPVFQEGSASTKFEDGAGGFCDTLGVDGAGNNFCEEVYSWAGPITWGCRMRSNNDGVSSEYILLAPGTFQTLNRSFSLHRDRSGNRFCCSIGDIDDDAVIAVCTANDTAEIGESQGDADLSHVNCVYDPEGNALSIYLDGVLATTDTPDSNFITRPMARPFRNLRSVSARVERTLLVKKVGMMPAGFTKE